MKQFSISGVAWNFRNNTACRDFSQAVYKRTFWTDISVTLDDFKTVVGTVTQAWLDDTECIWITANVKVSDNFEFRGLGLHWIQPQPRAPKRPIDPDSIEVVNIALCEPLHPECKIYAVNPL